MLAGGVTFAAAALHSAAVLGAGAAGGLAADALAEGTALAADEDEGAGAPAADVDGDAVAIPEFSGVGSFAVPAERGCSSARKGVGSREVLEAPPSLPQPAAINAAIPMHDAIVRDPIGLFLSTSERTISR